MTDEDGDPTPDLSCLTPHMLRIVELIVAGRTTKQIAAELCCSPITVRGWVHRITLRIGAQGLNQDNRVYLVLWYLRVTGKLAA